LDGNEAPGKAEPQAKPNQIVLSDGQIEARVRDRIKYLFSEDFMLRKKVVEILNRSGRYVLGYLPEQPIELEKDYSGDPLVITIKVWWKVPLPEKPVIQEIYTPEVLKGAE
jgi:hypothetical protein